MNREWKASVDKLYCALDLSRHVVGVTLLKDERDFERADAPSVKSSVNYCQMLASATRGHSLKACRNDFRCKSGPRVLGIDGSDPKNSHGENWARLGLYKDGDLSREIREELLYLPEAHYGVAVSPIEKLEDFPDTVLFIVNPYQAMRILQGYAYFYGSPKSLRMIGNQALCQECTARPFGTKDLNVSLLCIGTRHRTGWKDEEMAVGLPKEQFTSVVEGLMQTLNPMESDANKRIIEKKLQEKGIPFSVRYGYNYYMDC